MLWLPGVYGKENDMSGFYGAVVKDMYKKDVEQLISLLHQPLNQAGMQSGMPPQPGIWYCRSCVKLVLCGDCI